ncbi:hypothetical protein ACFLZV_04510, partial [Candidatus Margulisiibacteriota bacterium]
DEANQKVTVQSLRTIFPLPVDPDEPSKVSREDLEELISGLQDIGVLDSEGRVIKSLDQVDTSKKDIERSLLTTIGKSLQKIEKQVEETKKAEKTERVIDLLTHPPIGGFDETTFIDPGVGGLHLTAKEAKELYTALRKAKIITKKGIKLSNKENVRKKVVGRILEKTIHLYKKESLALIEQLQEDLSLSDEEVTELITALKDEGVLTEEGLIALPDGVGTPQQRLQAGLLKLRKKTDAEELADANLVKPEALEFLTEDRFNAMVILLHRSYEGQQETKGQIQAKLGEFKGGVVTEREMTKSLSILKQNKFLEISDKWSSKEGDLTESEKKEISTLVAVPNLSTLGLKHLTEDERKGLQKNIEKRAKKTEDKLTTIANRSRKRTQDTMKRMVLMEEESRPKSLGLDTANAKTNLNKISALINEKAFNIFKSDALKDGWLKTQELLKKGGFWESIGGILAGLGLGIATASWGVIAPIYRLVESIVNFTKKKEGESPEERKKRVWKGIGKTALITGLVASLPITGIPILLFGPMVLAQLKDPNLKKIWEGTGKLFKKKADDEKLGLAVVRWGLGALAGTLLFLGAPLTTLASGAWNTLKWGWKQDPWIKRALTKKQENETKGATLDRVVGLLLFPFTPLTFLFEAPFRALHKWLTTEHKDFKPELFEADMMKLDIAKGHDEMRKISRRERKQTKRIRKFALARFKKKIDIKIFQDKVEKEANKWTKAQIAKLPLRKDRPGILRRIFTVDRAHEKYTNEEHDMIIKPQEESIEEGLKLVSKEMKNEEEGTQRVTDMLLILLKNPLSMKYAKALFVAMPEKTRNEIMLKFSEIIKERPGEKANVKRFIKNIIVPTKDREDIDKQDRFANLTKEWYEKKGAGPRALTVLKYMGLSFLDYTIGLKQWQKDMETGTKGEKILKGIKDTAMSIGLLILSPITIPLLPLIGLINLAGLGLTAFPKNPDMDWVTDAEIKAEKVMEEELDLKIEEPTGLIPTAPEALGDIANLWKLVTGALSGIGVFITGTRQTTKNMKDIRKEDTVRSKLIKSPAYAKLASAFITSTKNPKDTTLLKDLSESEIKAFTKNLLSEREKNISEQMKQDIEGTLEVMAKDKRIAKFWDKFVEGLPPSQSDYLTSLQMQDMSDDEIIEFTKKLVTQFGVASLAEINGLKITETNLKTGFETRERVFKEEETELKKHKNNQSKQKQLIKLRKKFQKDEKTHFTESEKQRGKIRQLEQTRNDVPKILGKMAQNPRVKELWAKNPDIDITTPVFNLANATEPVTHEQLDDKVHSHLVVELSRELETEAIKKGGEAPLINSGPELLTRLTEGDFLDEKGQLNEDAEKILRSQGDRVIIILLNLLNGSESNKETALKILSVLGKSPRGRSLIKGYGAIVKTIIKKEEDEYQRKSLLRTLVEGIKRREEKMKGRTEYFGGALLPLKQANEKRGAKLLFNVIMSPITTENMSREVKESQKKLTQHFEKEEALRKMISRVAKNPEQLQTLLQDPVLGPEARKNLAKLIVQGLKQTDIRSIQDKSATSVRLLKEIDKRLTLREKQLLDKEITEQAKQNNLEVILKTVGEAVKIEISEEKEDRREQMVIFSGPATASTGATLIQSRESFKQNYDFFTLTTKANELLSISDPDKQNAAMKWFQNYISSGGVLTIINNPTLVNEVSSSAPIVKALGLAAYSLATRLNHDYKNHPEAFQNIVKTFEMLKAQLFTQISGIAGLRTYTADDITIGTMETEALPNLDALIQKRLNDAYTDIARHLTKSNIDKYIKMSPEQLTREQTAGHITLGEKNIIKDLQKLTDLRQLIETHISLNQLRVTISRDKWAIPSTAFCQTTAFYSKFPMGFEHGNITMPEMDSKKETPEKILNKNLPDFVNTLRQERNNMPNGATKNTLRTLTRIFSNNAGLQNRARLFIGKESLKNRWPELDIRGNRYHRIINSLLTLGNWDTFQLRKTQLLNQLNDGSIRLDNGNPLSIEQIADLKTGLENLDKLFDQPLLGSFIDSGLVQKHFPSKLGNLKNIFYLQSLQDRDYTSFQKLAPQITCDYIRNLPTDKNSLLIDFLSKPNAVKIIGKVIEDKNITYTEKLEMMQKILTLTSLEEREQPEILKDPELLEKINTLISRKISPADPEFTIPILPGESKTEIKSLVKNILTSPYFDKLVEKLEKEIDTAKFIKDREKIETDDEKQTETEDFIKDNLGKLMKLVNLQSEQGITPNSKALDFIKATLLSLSIVDIDDDDAMRTDDVSLSNIHAIINHSYFALPQRVELESHAKLKEALDTIKQLDPHFSFDTTDGCRTTDVDIPLSDQLNKIRYIFTDDPLLDIKKIKANAAKQLKTQHPDLYLKVLTYVADKQGTIHNDHPLKIILDRLGELGFQDDYTYILANLPVFNNFVKLRGAGGAWDNNQCRDLSKALFPELHIRRAAYPNTVIGQNQYEQDIKDARNIQHRKTQLKNLQFLSLHYNDLNAFLNYIPTPPDMAYSPIRPSNVETLSSLRQLRIEMSRQLSIDPTSYTPDFRKKLDALIRSQQKFTQNSFEAIRLKSKEARQKCSARQDYTPCTKRIYSLLLGYKKDLPLEPKELDKILKDLSTLSQKKSSEQLVSIFKALNKIIPALEAKGEPGVTTLKDAMTEIGGAILFEALTGKLDLKSLKPQFPMLGGEDIYPTVCTEIAKFIQKYGDPGSPIDIQNHFKPFKDIITTNNEKKAMVRKIIEENPTVAINNNTKNSLELNKLGIGQSEDLTDELTKSPSLISKTDTTTLESLRLKHMQINPLDPNVPPAYDETNLDDFLNLLTDPNANLTKDQIRDRLRPILSQPKYQNLSTVGGAFNANNFNELETLLIYIHSTAAPKLDQIKMELLKDAILELLPDNLNISGVATATKANFLTGIIDDYNTLKDPVNFAAIPNNIPNNNNDNIFLAKTYLQILLKTAIGEPADAPHPSTDKIVATLTSIPNNANGRTTLNKILPALLANPVYTEFLLKAMADNVGLGDRIRVYVKHNDCKLSHLHLQKLLYTKSISQGITVYTPTPINTGLVGNNNTNLLYTLVMTEPEKHIRSINQAQLGQLVQQANKQGTLDKIAPYLRLNKFFNNYLLSLDQTDVEDRKIIIKLLNSAGHIIKKDSVTGKFKFEFNETIFKRQVSNFVRTYTDTHKNAPANMLILFRDILGSPDLMPSAPARDVLTDIINSAIKQINSYNPIAMLPGGDNDILTAHKNAIFNGLRNLTENKSYNPGKNRIAAINLPRDIRRAIRKNLIQGLTDPYQALSIISNYGSEGAFKVPNDIPSATTKFYDIITPLLNLAGGAVITQPQTKSIIEKLELIAEKYPDLFFDLITKAPPEFLTALKAAAHALIPNATEKANYKAKVDRLIKFTKPLEIKKKTKILFELGQPNGLPVDPVTIAGLWLSG